MQDNDIVDVQLPPKDHTIITLVFRFLDREEIKLKTKRFTKFAKMMNTCAAHKGVNGAPLRFGVDGEDIREDDSPQDLGMQDGDRVDVRMSGICGC